VGALFNFGMALVDGQHAGEAFELLRRLISIEPDYPGAWVTLGWLKDTASNGKLRSIPCMKP
jgi:hypothetical protein